MDKLGIEYKPITNKEIIADEKYITLTDNDYNSIEKIASKFSKDELIKSYIHNKIPKLDLLGILKYKGFTVYDINNILKDNQSIRDIAILKETQPIEPRYKPEYIVPTQETMEYLLSPDLLYKIHILLAENIENESKNSLLCFLLGLSHKTPYKQMVDIKGESASGKNYIVNNSVLKFMPCKTRGRMSATAHEHGELNPYEILYIQQILGEQPESLKLISTSDGGYEIEITVYDRELGDYRTVIKKIPAITMITTTINVSIGVENETRAWTISIDDSPEQTKAILKKIDLIEKNKMLGKGIENITLRDIVSALPPVDVIYIPFDLNELLPTNNIRVRRDYDKFRDLIRLIAYLHYYQREKFDTADKKKAVMVDIKDVWYAIRIGGASIMGSVSGIDERISEIYNEISHMAGDPFTVNDLILRMKGSGTGKGTRTIYYGIKALLNNNSIIQLDEKKGNSKLYRCPQNDSILLKEPKYIELNNGVEFTVYDPITGETIQPIDIILPSVPLQPTLQPLNTLQELFTK